MEEAVNGSVRVGRVIFPGGAILIVSHTFAVLNNWYRVFPWVDVPLHFFWGVIGALLVYWFAHRFPGYLDLEKSFLVTLIFILGWTAFAGVLWEIGEFLYDLAIEAYKLDAPRVQFGVDDTLADISFGILGGFIVAVIMQLRYYKKGSHI